MDTRSRLFCTFTVLTLVVFTSSARGERTTRPEDSTVSARGITTLRLENLLNTDLTYTGTDEADTFTLRFERVVETDDEEKYEDVTSRLDLDIVETDNIVTVRLEHPEKGSRGFVKKLFRPTDWRAKITITGPAAIDLDLDADHSDIMLVNTFGIVKASTNFSDLDIERHIGRYVAEVNFCDVSLSELEGSFEIDANFSDVDLMLTWLDSDSELDISFCDAELRLPGNSGAVFHLEKHFGEIEFTTTGSLTGKNTRDSRRVLNEGGPIVELEAEFGSIHVRDDVEGIEQTGSESVGRKSSEEDRTKSRPRFERGVVRSISIRGTDFLKTDDVLTILDIREGDTYARDEIAKTIRELGEKDRFIDHASYTIDLDGNLKIRVYELEPIDFDYDISSAFSRVGGVGLGPALTMKSMLGPVSEFSAKTRYNWANREWTYNLLAEKRFFPRNQLAFGATYRRDYESNMDWALPARDSHLNAFFLGIETKNYYQVEGMTAFLSLSRGDDISVGVEFFDEEFRQLKKYTNWSLFNNKHTKEDNPRLPDPFACNLRGFRYSYQFMIDTRFMNSSYYLEAENETGGFHYTRYFGTTVHTWRLSSLTNMMLRLAGGYSSDNLPPQKSFRLGGPNTLRGFDIGDVPKPPAGSDGFDYLGGGNSMALCNIEYYYHLGHDNRLVLFGDIGSVWHKDESASINDLKRNIGVGLAFGDFFASRPGVRRPGRKSSFSQEGIRINWAIPVGNEPHVSRWTFNWVNAF